MTPAERIFAAFEALDPQVAKSIATDLKKVVEVWPPLKSGVVVLSIIGEYVLDRPKQFIKSISLDQHLAVSVLLGEACEAARHLTDEFEPYASISEALVQAHEEATAGDCFRCR